MNYDFLTLIRLAIKKLKKISGISRDHINSSIAVIGVVVVVRVVVVKRGEKYEW